MTMFRSSVGLLCFGKRGFRLFTSTSCSLVSPNFRAKNLTKKYGRDVTEEAGSSRPGFWSVTAYATAEEYDLIGLVEALKAKNAYNLCELTGNEPLKSNKDLSFGLHTMAKHDHVEENSQIYYFHDGTVVFWNVSCTEQRFTMNFLKDFESKCFDSDKVTSEMEDMEYTYESNRRHTFVNDGVMYVGTMDKSKDEIASEMYALSNAIAQSVKLGVLESLLTEYINGIEKVTEDLKKGIPIKISERTVLKKSGELFALRHIMNLSSDLTDTPDFYWDREKLEILYRASCSYFSIPRRTKVMNERLTHCIELIQLVSSHLSDRHHIRLEWMIIVLIMVEVAFEFIHAVRLWE